MNVLDLFSGIGGFSLGLERAGMRAVAFCEIDPFCRAVLRKHWPDVPIYNDIRTLKVSSLPRVDLICGGFPCQPFSTASRGKRLGDLDDRWLWPEMRRLISEIRPTWVIGENVVGIEGMALEQVVSDLESLLYEVAPPLEIPACAVGHDHRRSRYWFIGHSDSRRESGRAFDEKASWVSWHRVDSGSSRGADGFSNRMDRIRSLGNAVVPQIPEIIGRAIMHAEGLA